MAKKQSLGMGLDALFGDNGGETSGAQTLRVSDIEPNRKQPRQNFDDAAIAELADSIRQHGLIQPIVVRSVGAGYQIVAGERRWRACRMLGMSEVPVIVKELDDSQTAQIALIENIQREDLNPVEEAMAYRSLMEDYEMTQEQLSKVLGKSRSTIANSVRLLNLPDSIVDMLKKREISVGQAKALAAAETEDEMLELAKLAASGKITVRGIEKAIAKSAAEDDEDEELPTVAETPEKRANLSFITEMQLSLENHLERKVRISSKDGIRGSITIDFYDQEELTTLSDKLTMY